MLLGEFAQQFTELSKVIYASVLDIYVGTDNVAALVREREAEVARNGKFSKQVAGYIAAPIFPPILWEYQCSECRFWQSGACDIVQGRIEGVGTCFLWVPPEGYERPFTWIQRIPTVLANTRRGLKNLVTDPFSERSVR